MTNPRGAKPLTSSSFYVLLALKDGPKHGLGIAAEIEERTSGEVRLGPGTLYNAIKKMLQQKLIADERSRPEPEDDDPRRRYYRITRTGETALAAEASRLDRLLRAARAKAALP
ncbi:MAG TPA: helix-turn-helix transcriptional regulator [Vicinamibacteria bacterium]|jgi:DNA-binding PadR family transcriptional regulator